MEQTKAFKCKPRPIDILAIQWNGDNLEEISEFVGDEYANILDVESSADSNGIHIELCINIPHGGSKYIRYGDYIIKGFNDAFFICNKEDFDKAYHID